MALCVLTNNKGNSILSKVTIYSASQQTPWKKLTSAFGYEYYFSNVNKHEKLSKMTKNIIH